MHHPLGDAAMPRARGLPRSQRLNEKEVEYIYKRSMYIWEAPSEQSGSSIETAGIRRVTATATLPETYAVFGNPLVISFRTTFLCIYNSILRVQSVLQLWIFLASVGMSADSGPGASTEYNVR